MFRRKRDKDLSRSYSLTADSYVSPRSAANASPAAAAAAFSASSNRNSAVLSSAAAATAIKRHSLTSEQSHLAHLDYGANNSGARGRSTNGRTYSLMSGSGLSGQVSPPTLRRTPSNATGTTNNGSNSRRTSLPSSSSIPQITTTVETSSSGRTMSLTTTTVRRFGAFELIKTNTTTTGNPSSLRAGGANNSRPFSQFTQVGPGARAGYASSVLSYESDLNPVYEDEPLTKPTARSGRPRGGSPTPKIAFSVPEEEADGVDDHNGAEKVKLHVPPPRSASPIRPALKDSSQASSIASSDDMSSANNLQVSVTSTSDATTNEQQPSPNYSSNNIPSPNRVLGKKPRREVSFVDINGGTLEDYEEDLPKPKTLSPIEAAARRASVRNQSAKFHSESTKLVEQRRNKQSAAAAAASSFKKPVESIGSPVATPHTHSSSARRMSVESSDSGHSVYSDALEEIGSPLRSIDDVVLRRNSTRRKHKTDHPVSPTKASASTSSKSKPKSPTKAKFPVESTVKSAIEPATTEIAAGTTDSPSKGTSEFQPLELGDVSGNISEDLNETLLPEHDGTTIEVSTDAAVSPTENGALGAPSSSHYAHHYRQLAESDDDSDAATTRDYQTPVVSSEQVDKQHMTATAAPDGLEPRGIEHEPEELVSEKAAIPEDSATISSDTTSSTAKNLAGISNGSRGSNGHAHKKVNIVEEPKVNIISQDSFDDDITGSYEADYENENDIDDNISLSSDSSWQRERTKKKVPRKSIMLSMRSDETAVITPHSKPVSVLNVPKVATYKPDSSRKPGASTSRSGARSSATASGKGFKVKSLRGSLDPPASRISATAPALSSDSDDPVGSVPGAGSGGGGGGFLSSFKSRFADSDSEDDDAGYYSSYLDQPSGQSRNGGGSSSGQKFKSLRKPKSQPQMSSIPVPPVSSIPQSNSLSHDVHRLSTLPETPESPAEESAKQRVSSNGSSKSKFKSMFSPNNQAKVLVQKKDLKKDRVSSSQSTKSSGQSSKPSKSSKSSKAPKTAQPPVISAPYNGLHYDSYDPSATTSTVSGGSGKKKRFPGLRKVFNLD